MVSVLDGCVLPKDLRVNDVVVFVCDDYVNATCSFPRFACALCRGGNTPRVGGSSAACACSIAGVGH